MATISTLAYKIVADTQNFLNGVKLSRAEMRTAKAVMKDSIEPMTAWQAELDALAVLHTKGALTLDQYTAAVERQNAANPEAIAAAKAQAEAQQQAMQAGKSLTESLATTEEVRNQRIQEAKGLLDQNAISQETYNRAVREMDVERWQEMGTSIRNTSAAIAAVAAGVSATLGMIGRDLVQTWQVQEAAEAKLMAIMSARGTATEGAFERYREFANEMQRVTVIGDEMTLGMLQQAEALGLSGREAERAAKNAIALGSAVGISADAALRMTAALEQGDTQMLNRYMRELRQIEDPILRAAKAQEMLTDMFAAAEAEALTSAGAYAQMQNAIGDTKEEFGKFIGDALIPVYDRLKGAAIALDGLSDGAKQSIIVAGMATGGVAAFTAALAASVAIAGQGVIWYGALTKALGGVTLASKAATVAKLALGKAMLAVPYIAAAAAIVAISRAIYVSMPSVRAFNAAMEESARLADQLAQRETRQREQVFSIAVDLQGDEKVRYLQEQLELAERNMQGLSAASAMSKEEAERLEPTLLSLGQAGRKVWQVQVAEYEEMRARYGDASEQVRRLREELEKAEATMTAAPNKAVEDLTAKLREQIATVGYSAEQVERWKLAQEGANEAQLRQVALLQREAAARREAVSLRDDTNELVDALQRQIETAGMSADAIQLMDLRARGLSESWVTLIEKMQQGAAATREAANTQADLDSLVKSLEEQIATAGMSADEMERYRLAQRGVGTEALAVVEALQQQSAAAIEVAESQKRARDEALAAQQALQSNLDQTTDRLREQIKTYGMSADEAELWRLKDKGATDDQIAAIKLMQDELAALQGQKDAMRSSETTIGAGSLADAYDAIQRAQEAAATQTVTPPVVEVLAIAGGEAALQAEDRESPEVPILERIAAGIDALVRKEGIVIEEVSV